MWVQVSYTLSPLISITLNKAPFKWTHIEQTSFEKIIDSMSRYLLISYPNFNILSDIQTDDSHSQLGSVTIQELKTTFFYHKK